MGRNPPLKRSLERCVPRYARLPLVAMLGVNMIAYYGARLFTAGAARIDMALPLDGRIPFCPAFIVFYILAYAQWFFGFICIARESRETCFRVLGGEMLAKLICLILFIALPTEMIRPDARGEGVWLWLVRLIYRTDAPVNLFPSIHCLDSWICFRGAVGLKRTPRWYAPSMLVMTLLVLASTVLVKQHVLADIPAGILAAEVGLFLSRRLRLDRAFLWMESRRRAHGAKGGPQEEGE